MRGSSLLSNALAPRHFLRRGRALLSVYVIVLDEARTVLEFMFGLLVEKTLVITMQSAGGPLIARLRGN